MATWLVATSVVVAPTRFANERSAAGGMASSLTATMYQVGNDFQAATPITSAKVDMDNGCCTACITSARAGSFTPPTRAHAEGAAGGSVRSPPNAAVSPSRSETVTVSAE